MRAFLTLRDFFQFHPGALYAPRISSHNITYTDEWTDLHDDYPGVGIHDQFGLEVVWIPPLPV
jgi:hypothetical protein